MDAPKLWSPEIPHLYDVTLELKTPDGQVDSVSTYYGLRTIAHGRFGDAPFERILLNGKPVYLRTALDQSFNPKGALHCPRRCIPPTRHRDRQGGRPERLAYPH